MTLSNWDDLRIFMAAARSGSFTQAASRLTVDASTVARRIARLESALRATLVARTPKGLKLTAAGARLFDASTAVESAMESAEAISDHGSVRGTVRISAFEGLGSAIVAPAMPALLRRHPGLRIELIANAGFLSPSIREVDIGISLSPPHTPRVTGERLGDCELGLYASEALLDRSGPIESVEGLLSLPFVGYIDDLLYPPELRYLADIHPAITPAMTSSSVRAQLEIIRAGGALGILPCFLAVTAGADLRRVLPSKVSLRRTLWIAAHKDVTETARVKAVYRWLHKLVSDSPEIFTPSQSSSTPRISCETTSREVGNGSTAPGNRKIKS